MDIKFIVNDYILVWNLLFRASVNEKVHKFKQKLWLNYKNEYNETYNDRIIMLKDIKNYIPNDDTIYNLVFETKEYQNLKKSLDKYRLEIIKLWNKKLNIYLKNILKKDITNYNIFLVNPDFDILETLKVDDNVIVIFGKKLDKNNFFKNILDIISNILYKEIKEYEGNNKLIADAIIEMAIYNELATNITDNSHYFMGNNKYTYIKRQIYPYWLMYLGVREVELSKYMSRDKIVFDIDKYAYNEDLVFFNLEEFIDFCIENQRYMFKFDNIEVI